MSALGTLTRTQSKVLLREPMAVFFGLVFPALVLIVIGTISHCGRTRQRTALR